jgi:capsular exopolysaccharide synthesis family protein
VELAAWHSRTGPLADSVRSIRTSLLLAQRDRGFPKSLVMTSPEPSDGKTTVAANLAISLAEVFPRVLLIDGDLPTPRLHEIFGVPHGPGLGELLAGTWEARRPPLAGYLRATAIPGLTLLPAGAAADPSTLSAHLRRAEEILRRCEAEFDAVVIDAPETVCGDARVWSRLSAAAVLVVRAHRTSTEELWLARNRLLGDGSRLLGVILNAWDSPRGQHTPSEARRDRSPRPPLYEQEKHLAASA